MLKYIWDKIGICASALCLVHCLATPLLFLAFPAINSHTFENFNLHLLLGLVVVTSALVAILPHCRRHNHKDIALLAITGCALIMAGIFVGHNFGEFVEHIITMFGSLLLITAHFKNIKVRHGKCETTAPETFQFKPVKNEKGHVHGPNCNH